MFNFEIWWLQNISPVFSFAISVKIRNESSSIVIEVIGVFFFFLWRNFTYKKSTKKHKKHISKQKETAFFIRPKNYISKQKETAFFIHTRKYMSKHVLNHLKKASCLLFMFLKSISEKESHLYSCLFSLKMSKMWRLLCVLGKIWLFVCFLWIKVVCLLCYVFRHLGA